MVRDARGMAIRWAGRIAWAALLLGGIYLAVAPRPSPAASGLAALAAELLDPALFERRAEAALERWRPSHETDDEPANAENTEPIDAHDGLYVGMATTRADGRVVTIELKVTNGIGAGTQIQRECGATPIALKDLAHGQRHRPGADVRCRLPQDGHGDQGPRRRRRLTLQLEPGQSVSGTVETLSTFRPAGISRTACACAARIASARGFPLRWNRARFHLAGFRSSD